MKVSRKNAATLAGQYVKTIKPYPNGFHGRGIVTCAGGLKYNTCAWVLIRMLRNLGCRLPIQAWYLGEQERDDAWIALAKPFDVECIDAETVRKRHPHPRLGGWELKPYAILHCPFREVLFLDADNIPVRDPSYLFDESQYHDSGAIFWPDCVRTPPESRRWPIFGVPYRDEWDLESGQILVDKERCWAPLNLCNWYNEHSDFFYRVVWGDKDTFRFAWHRLNQSYAMPKRPLVKLRSTFGQHDMNGRRVFQHRCFPKWSFGDNPHVPGTLYEEVCLQFISELHSRCDPTTYLMKRLTPADLQRMDELVGQRFDIITTGYDISPIVLRANLLIGEGRANSAHFWWIEGQTLVVASAGGMPTIRLNQQPNGAWQGRAVNKHQIRVRLVPSSLSQIK